MALLQTYWVSFAVDAATFGPAPRVGPWPKRPPSKPHSWGLLVVRRGSGLFVVAGGVGISQWAAAAAQFGEVEGVVAVDVEMAADER